MSLHLRMILLLVVPLAVAAVGPPREKAQHTASSLALSKPAPPTEKRPETPLTAAESLLILQKSKDSDDIVRAVWSLANSADPEALDRLLPFLVDLKFWERVDMKYGPFYPSDDPVHLILMEIAEPSSPKLEALFLKLSTDATFMAHSKRRTSLSYACGWIRSPSAKCLNFLDTRQDSELAIAIGSLIRIATPDAAKVVEKHLLSGTFTKYKKEAFLIGDLLVHRDQMANLQLLERLLRSVLADDDYLRPVIVQVLFDYKTHPDHRVSQGAPEPPPRTYASTEVLERLITIADAALKLHVSDEIKQGVRKEKKAIQRILAFRQDGGQERVAKLIVNLESEEFATRDQAERELEKVVRMAEPALRRALAGNPSVEGRRRLERLIDKLPRPKPPVK